MKEGGPLNVLLKCGCRAMSLGLKAGEPETARRPACIVHDCFDVADVQPSLAGRRARCDYYGRTTRRSECNYNGDRDGVCYCEQPSTLALPFFVFRGQGSEQALHTCRDCNYRDTAHEPLWEASIELDREWFKRGRHRGTERRTFHAPLGTESERASAVAARYLYHGWPETKPETCVYGATVVGLSRLREKELTHLFVGHGPYEFDQFYCGCHSWD